MNKSGEHSGETVKEVHTKQALRVRGELVGSDDGKEK
jgi:hypothetical protein